MSKLIGTLLAVIPILLLVQADAWAQTGDESSTSSGQAAEEAKTGAAAEAPAKEEAKPAEAGKPAEEVKKTEEKKPEGEEAQPPAKEEFIKGELTNIGATEVISEYNHFGVRAGGKMIGKDYYLALSPDVGLGFGKLKFNIQIPLNYKFYDYDSGKYHKLTFRKKDYDEKSDYLKAIKYLTYGRKEDPIHISMDSVFSNTLGHGTIMRRYNANIDIDRSRTGLVFDAYKKNWAGFEFMTNDLLAWKLFGVLGFVYPMGPFVSSDSLLGTLSVGVVYVTDQDAPRCLLNIDGDCFQGDQSLKKDEAERPLYKARTVSAVGVSTEMAIYDSASSKIKPFVDISKLQSGGNGLTGGIIGRFNFGKNPINALRLTIEGRSFSAKYRPSYFDTLYEISKYQYFAGKDAQGNPHYVTKYQGVFDESSGGRKLGYYADFTYAVMKSAEKKYFALGLGVDDSTVTGDSNFFMHGELPALGFLQIFGTYYKMNASAASKFFDFKEQNSILFSGVRLEILPILYLNGQIMRTFEVEGNKNPPFQNRMIYNFNIEVGVEFH